MTGEEIQPCRECQGRGWYECREYLGLDDMGEGVWEEWQEPCESCNSDAYGPRRIPIPPRD